MFKITALFIVLLAFVSCGRTQKPLADVVTERTVSETEITEPDVSEPLGDVSELLEVISETDDLPDPSEAEPLVAAEQVDYYASVDAAFENADVIADASGDPGLFFLSGNFHTLISAELGVPYTLEVDSAVAGAYREAKGLPPDAELSREQTAREYLKLRLEFPEETHEEIMERYKSSLQPIP